MYLLKIGHYLSTCIYLKRITNYKTDPRGNTSGRSSQRSSTYGSRNAEVKKSALPPIASSGVTSEAVASVQDDDIFIPEETAAPIKEEEECEEGDETSRDDNV